MGFYLLTAETAVPLVRMNPDLRLLKSPLPASPQRGEGLCWFSDSCPIVMTGFVCLFAVDSLFGCSIGGGKGSMG